MDITTVMTMKEMAVHMTCRDNDLTVLD